MSKGFKNAVSKLYRKSRLVRYYEEVRNSVRSSWLKYLELWEDILEKRDYSFDLKDAFITLNSLDRTEQKI